MSFLERSLGYLIPAKPPSILWKLRRLALSNIYHSFEAFGTCFKVTRVITLAPLEVQPYRSCEQRYLPFMEVIRKENRHFIPWGL